MRHKTYARLGWRLLQFLPSDDKKGFFYRGCQIVHDVIKSVLESALESTFEWSLNRGPNRCLNWYGIGAGSSGCGATSGAA
jgi:hypothetical protein